MIYNLEQAIDILERTPNTLKTMLLGLSKDWVYSNEGEDTWSPFDIIGHLIHGEKTDWIRRSELILSHSENKMFDAFDRFAQFDNSKGKTLEVLLEEFAELRSENLETLKGFNVTTSKLDMTGLHPEFGVVTLRQQLATWVTHDLAHMAQIARVMAKQYKEEVGPWKAYIPILNA